MFHNWEMLEIAELEIYYIGNILMESSPKFPDSRKNAFSPPCFIISTSLTATSAICAFEELGGINDGNSSKNWHYWTA